MKRIVLASLAVFALALASCSSRAPDPVGEPRSWPSAQTSIPEADNPIEQVVQEVLPAVVNVVSETSQGAGEGTGFIVREDGIVVTNYHVVETASAVRVLTSDDPPTEYDARVIGGDVQADLAILDVDADGLPTVPLGDSDSLQLGQQVVAIGYALGLEGGPSVTAGIVSSLTRQIAVTDVNCPDCGPEQRRVYGEVIQTDAAINPGNSGGPLVDLAGNVVGINTAGTTTAENVGFAIQINSVKETIAQAAENPDAPVAYMGIQAADANHPQVQVDLDPPVDEGAAIVYVAPDGPADGAGVDVGDVVVEFDGEPVSTADELGDAIRAHRPGEEVEFVVVRGTGERTTLTVVLGVNPVPVG
jgi:S1-C subfamily serine protease